MTERRYQDLLAERPPVAEQDGAQLSAISGTAGRGHRAGRDPADLRGRDHAGAERA